MKTKRGAAEQLRERRSIVTRRAIPVLPIVLVAASVSACGAPDSSEEASLAIWNVSSEPLLTIGEMDGDPDYLFGRIVDARLFSDGRIAVADNLPPTVHLYDAAGRFLTNLGREGEGPGEFGWVDAVWIGAADTVSVFDSDLRRITRFLPDGSVVEIRSLSVPLGSPAFLGSFRGGDVGVGWVRFHLNEDGSLPPTKPVLVSDTMDLARMGRDGKIFSSLGFGLGYRRFDGWNDPISPAWHAAVYQDSLFFTDGMRDISVRDRNGTIGRSIRLPQLSIDPAIVWDVVARAVEKRQSERRSETMRNVPRHDLIPRISKMLIDDAGFIWLKRFEPRDASVLTNHLWWNGGEWVILDQRGRHAATVQMPDELMPLQIRGDRILGFFRDEFNVERVRIYVVER